MRLLIAALLSTCLVIPAIAQDWPLADMNKAIEQTNVIVNDGCSGTLISLEKKYVLTNNHCVDNKIEIIEEEVVSDEGFVKKVKRKRFHDVKITQWKYDGYTKVQNISYQAEIIAADMKRDLAVVQLKGDIPQTYASPLLPEDKPVTRGERIYTVGNPAMWESSVFEGIVANVNRTFEFPWTGGEKTPMIQFSGGIVGGNSGGAIYNTKGQLIGVPSAGRGEALGLAIPVTTVRVFMKDNCIAEGFVNGAVNADCKAAKEKKKKKKDE